MSFQKKLLGAARRCVGAASLTDPFEGKGPKTAQCATIPGRALYGEFLVKVAHDMRRQAR
jgi:hypothetical protein